MPEARDERPEQDRTKEDRVDEALDETFPASDAPAYSAGTATPSDSEDTERPPAHLEADEDDDA